MTFRVSRTSWLSGGYPEPVYEKDNGYFIDINTIDELMAFEKAVGHALIVSNTCEPSIEIYDGYRE